MSTIIRVAPDGRGDGSRAGPCGLDALQAVLERAQVTSDGAVTVEFADGRYEVTDALRIRSFGAADGGPGVRLVAADKARPVLCGGRPISGWELHDESRNIWRAVVPVGVDFEHLWWGHQRLVRAWSGWNPPGFKVSRRGLKMTDGAPSVDRWGNRGDIVVIKKMMWRKVPAPVVAVEGDELCLDPHHRAACRVPSTALGVMEPVSLYGLLNFLEPRTAGFALENAYKLLTDEGEWYLDRSTDMVYVKPFGDCPFTCETPARRSR